MRGLLPLLLLCAAMLSACAGGNGRPILFARAVVPFTEEAVSQGPQTRVIPWSQHVLKARASYRIVPEIESTDSPAFFAAEARLAARETARVEVARQLSRLPAAEAPPGETTDLNVADFSRRRTGLDQFIAQGINSASEEIAASQGGEAILEMQLPLMDIAQEILNQGGGFSPDGAVAQSLGPRRNAMQQAERDAKAELLRQVLEYRITPQTTVADWIRQDSSNREFLLNSIGQAHVIQSRARRDDLGTEEWVVELEYNPIDLEQRAQEQERMSRRNSPR